MNLHFFGKQSEEAIENYYTYIFEVPKIEFDATDLRKKLATRGYKIHRSYASDIDSSERLFCVVVNKIIDKSTLKNLEDSGYIGEIWKDDEE